MPSIEPLLIPRFVASIAIEFRSIGLIIFKFFLNIFVDHLKRLCRLVIRVGRFVEFCLGIVTGNHYSLVNVADDDFSIGTTAEHLFDLNDKTQDRNNPKIHDIFHIYLSKILYESDEFIKQKCQDWGFDPESIDILRYEQADNLKTYTYSTKAAVIYYKQSNRIVIAFRGTQPTDLVQWMTDASTNWTPIKNVLSNAPIDPNSENQVLVHEGFYAALGLGKSNKDQPTPIFIQLLNSIEKFSRNGQCQLTITGHSLGAALASLFTYVLLSSPYGSSISGLYTYGQPLVGNRRYAQILSDQLQNRIHRWVNHCDIVTRIPVIALPSLAWYFTRTPYSDGLEAATNQRTRTESLSEHYFHSGLTFKIDHEGHLIEQNLLDEGSILPYHDRMDLFHFAYSIQNAIYSLLNITPLRSLFWLTAPADINDHFPGDYARKIKQIVAANRH